MCILGYKLLQLYVGFYERFGILVRNKLWVNLPEAIYCRYSKVERTSHGNGFLPMSVSYSFVKDYPELFLMCQCKFT